MTEAEQADRLDDAASRLKSYARVLRGEAEDLTGLGLWRIFCDVLEHAANVKVTTPEVLENWERYRAALQSIAQHSPAYESRREAEAALDGSNPSGARQ